MPKRPTYEEIKEKLEIIEKEVLVCKQKLSHLDEDRKRFHDLIQKAPFGHIVCNEKGDIIAFNTRAKDLLSHILGKKGKKPNLFKLDTLKNIDLSTILSNCLIDIPFSHQCSILTTDDRVVYLQWHFLPIKDKTGKLDGIQAIVNDISERKRIETQIIHAHRLESIGALASGIAHDFNNIIWIINGNLELAFSDLPAGTPARYHLEQAEQACERAQNLVTQISNFSRTTNNQQQRFDLCPIIKESLKFLRASIPANINIQTHISEHPIPVLADITQINQMLMHLYANAVQAIGDTVGSIEVNLLQITIDRTETIDSNQVLPGDYVLLSVYDTGVGMSPKIQKHIFDPFFTTKEQNESAGIGLFIVKAIVKSHNGLIRVSSHVNGGSKFNIFLPLAEKETNNELFRHTLISDIPKGCERILLVDDEEQIVKFGTSMLTNLGYHITAQTSSLKALKTFRTNPAHFDLVITDEDMPDMRGSELARQISEVRADIPIILITGHRNESHISLKGITTHLEKPLRRIALAETIRSVLDQKVKVA